MKYKNTITIFVYHVTSVLVNIFINIIWPFIFINLINKFNGLD